MLAASAAWGVEPSMAQEAVANLRSGRVASAVFSGKLASGKDSVADAVGVRLAELGLGQARVHQTSEPMRRELDEIIAIVGAAPSEDDAVLSLAREQNLSYLASVEITRVLFEKTRGALPKASERTDTNRYLLQYLADEGRRSADPDYWVRKFFPTLMADLAEGRSALLSGIRHPNEILPAQVLGIMTVRLAVSRGVQENRLRGRDGLAPNPALIDSVNECALDGFVGFNLVVGNDDDMGATVSCVIDHLIPHVQGLLD